MKNADQLAELEEQLNSFDPAERQQALKRLAEGKHPHPPEGTNVNMHFHSFFSYNAEGYSPSRIAWEAHKAGLYAAGLCDFDVIDGLEEFMQAGLSLGLRTTVNLETRAYVKEFANVDINSPGEQGVTYVMGAGFARELPKGSFQEKGLAGYRARACARNIALIERINARLPDIAIDYEKDVLPLTPTGSATERHIISAYLNKSKAVFQHPDATVEFWTKIIGQPFLETAMLFADTPSFEEVVRSKLVKRGGIGYEAPSPSTFPPIDEFTKWVASCEAVPMLTWLDGTSGGEKDSKAFLECMKSNGAVAINLIPDRNWNIANPEQRAVKIAKLNEIVKIADSMDMPINIGTEMNKLGLPFVDDLDKGALKPHKESFLRGARIMIGHSLLLRYAGMSYISAKANSEFAAPKAKNAFFEAVGRLPAMDSNRAKELEDTGQDKALAWFHDKVKE